jgi:hypothetical protein
VSVAKTASGDAFLGRLLAGYLDLFRLNSRSWKERINPARRTAKASKLLSELVRLASEGPTRADIQANSKLQPILQSNLQEV